MNACHACERTHNQDVRDYGRCYCPCHGTRSALTAEQWERAPYQPTNERNTPRNEHCIRCGTALTNHDPATTTLGPRCARCW